MKELVIVSGKGGTGKTTVVASFAGLARNKVVCDADVDAADLHLILAPEVEHRHDFVSGHKAVIIQDKCSQCGLCRDLCRRDAIDAHYVVDSLECEGCGVCYYFCPEKAIEFPDNKCGEWFISSTRFGPMVHARLGIAEENSGKLVTLVRQEAKKIAEKRQFGLILTDGPPGVGCPVIACIGGASAALIVAEPTVSGRHDMERVIQLANHFKVPCLLCINKYDLNPAETDALESLAKSEGIPIVGKLPFDLTFTRAMVQGKTVLELGGDSNGAKAVREAWSSLSQALGL